ncbi:MBL fold metallo-hydrolase [Sphingobium jiangsuense]|uniref:Ribonuclease BN (tRNA processing enzyme) n=1 Tax=Sphingobium jiangsuense TaxID=870476 RepID=A0A7W6BFI2_9SPHN|nr:MBL fold metallo-hydrolase [Sphingobium jiangsuense]MBB3925968.1 ribonuclease BN (tRNA processing enzyme) [Sphingobium jiangsuense]GLS98901.1 MBL fold metallo-hydrolase [Sphingobium jiangsuense]
MSYPFLSLMVAGAVGLSLAPAWAGEARPSPPPSPATQAVAQEGTRLILLGTAGGPVTSADRSQPASLLVVGGRPYLIDCGDGTTGQLRKAGFAANDIGHVFFTHLHIDHTAGLASLMAFNWVSGHRQVMRVFGPPGSEQLVRKAADYLTGPAEIHGAVLPPHPPLAAIAQPQDLEVGQEKLVFEDDRLRVFAVANSHYVATDLPKRAYGRDRAYSYRFETADRTIVFTGDTGPSAALEKFARNADILVSEVIDIDATNRMLKRQYAVSDEQLAPLVKHMVEEHLVPAEIGKLAAKAGVGMVVLSHVAPVTDEPIDPPRYTRGVRETFRGPVILGRDLDEF